jgi:putative transposase
MAIKQEIINELLSNYKNPEDLLGADAIMRQLKKALLERALSAEMTDHLGYEKSEPQGQEDW